MSARRRVLIVEDEMLVSMLIEDALTAIGVEIAGTVGTLEEAMTQAHNGGFDCAILDVHLHGREVFPVAEILKARGLPFIFATGYGESGLPERYRACPVLQKPFMPAELEHVLATVLAPG
jgi:CheY-like chemotaxis protein